MQIVYQDGISGVVILQVDDKLIFVDDSPDLEVFKTISIEDCMGNPITKEDVLSYYKLAVTKRFEEPYLDTNSIFHKWAVNIVNTSIEAFKNSDFYNQPEEE